MQMRAFLRWLFIEPWPVWLAISVPVVSLSVLWWLPCSGELNVRMTGYLLTVLGIVVVVRGIRDKVRLFDRPSFRHRLRAWLGRMPNPFASPQPRSVTLQASAAGASFMGGNVELSVTPGPGAPIDQRVLALERDLSNLRARFSAAEQRIGTEMQELRQSYDRELKAMKAADEQTRTRLEELSVGSLDFELAAVVWVLFGSLYTTFPQELANAINRFLSIFAVAGG